jgi:hypothetical protein
MIHRMKRLARLFKIHGNRVILKIMVQTVFLFELHPDKHSNRTASDESMKGGDGQVGRPAAAALGSLQFLTKKLREQRPWKVEKMSRSSMFLV